MWLFGTGKCILFMLLCWMLHRPHSCFIALKCHCFLLHSTSLLHTNLFPLLLRFFSGLIPFYSMISGTFLRSQLLSLATDCILLYMASLQRQTYDIVERVITQNRVNKMWWYCCVKLAEVKIKRSLMPCEASHICAVYMTLQNSARNWWKRKLSISHI